MTKLEEWKKLLNESKFSEALILLNQFLSENNNNADALFYRAICYRKLEQYQLSINDFNSIIIRINDDASLYSERAVSYYHLKDYTAAVSDLNKAVELEPNNPYRYSSRAYIRAYIDIDGAIKDYEKAIELDPKDDISYNNLGLLQENLGNIRQAQENFKRNEALLKTTEKKEPQPPITKTENLEEENLTFWKVIKQLVTSKDTQQEFKHFLKSKFKKI